MLPAQRDKPARFRDPTRQSRSACSASDFQGSPIVARPSAIWRSGVFSFAGAARREPKPGRSSPCYGEGSMSTRRESVTSGSLRLGRGCHLFDLRRDRQRLLSVFVDPVHEPELVARILAAAEKRRRCKITYLTAWTLVQAYRDEEFSRLLSTFDLIYADGMGVVLTLFFTRLRRCKKTTAEDFFLPLAREAAQRGLSLALVGATERSIRAAICRIRQEIPTLHIAYCHAGFISKDQREAVLQGLVDSNADLVVLGMGQPLQERWAELLQGRVRAPVYCVGGLFDLLSGEVPAPPAWMRRFGLEWLHRLGTRPRRCWRRYVMGLPALAAIALADPWVRWFRGRAQNRARSSLRDE